MKCPGAAGTEPPWDAARVSHPRIFPVKPDRSGPRSPGMGGPRLSLEGTRSPVPSSPVASLSQEQLQVTTRAA